MTRMLTRVFDQQTAVVGMVRALEHERDTALHNFELSQTQLDDTKTQLDDTKNQLDDTKNQLDDAKNQLDESINKFIALCTELKFSEQGIIDRLSKEFGFSPKESKQRLLQYKKT